MSTREDEYDYLFKGKFNSTIKQYMEGYIRMKMFVVFFYCWMLFHCVLLY